jgi:predicted phosphoribosyltransferase
MQAGRLLANEIIKKYDSEDFVVVALSDGGVVVGAQIALQLHTIIMLLLADEIELPREMVAIAGITQDGAFTYNQAYSPGEIEEMVSEYRGTIEQQKMEKLREMHAAVGKEGLIDEELLEDKHIILVSDGLSSGFSIDLALEYLKPVNYQSLIVATPFASTLAVDRMHILADDIFCLSVIEDYYTTNHYYDTQDVPEHEVVVQTIQKVLHDWKPGEPSARDIIDNGQPNELKEPEKIVEPITEVILDLASGRQKQTKEGGE